MNIEAANDRPIARVLDRGDPASQQILNMTLEEARKRVLSGDPEAVRGIQGSFALVARDGEKVFLARSLDRPLRYFLAKETAGPMLAVAERINDLAACLDEEGYGEQFHPSYSRMVPAHHVTSLRLIGCPDPNPDYLRFFTPPRGVLPADLDLIGRRYVEALCSEISDWLTKVQSVDSDAPIGVLFSGGLDSGAVLLCLYQVMLDQGLSPSRLKAFTLSIDGAGPDAEQAQRFLDAVDLGFLGEVIEAPAAALDPIRAVEVIEDYKPLDVECAAAAMALAEGIRARYPDWRLLVDGDGGDENLKDYPIEENHELTIRSVVGNSMLYQEGWGVSAIKHSLTYSGGYSRGCVRTWAPLRQNGFSGFSPFTRPAVIEVAEAIPFDELAAGSHERLYALKGEVLSRGVKAVIGRDLPVFEKRRFQHGAAPAAVVAERFGADPLAGHLAIQEARYRSHFLAHWASRQDATASVRND